jgi:hypothetical protein
VGTGVDISVVVGGVVAAGVAAGAVVSVFCSHAASSAALVKINMYFFIVMIRLVTLRGNGQVEWQFFSRRIERWQLLVTTVIEQAGVAFCVPRPQPDRLAAHREC